MARVRHDHVSAVNAEGVSDAAALRSRPPARGVHLQRHLLDDDLVPARKDFAEAVAPRLDRARDRRPGGVGLFPDRRGNAMKCSPREMTMNRRRALFGMAAAAATIPITLRADDAAMWSAWWERSKKYTLAIA